MADLRRHQQAPLKAQAHVVMGFEVLRALTSVLTSTDSVTSDTCLACIFLSVDEHVLWIKMKVWSRFNMEKFPTVGEWAGKAEERGVATRLAR